MAVASEVKDIGFRPDIVNLGKYEHRKGNLPSRNSLNFQDSVEVLYAGMKPSLAQVENILRQGELIGLQWGDIDFHGGFLEVRQETRPKSHKIRRVHMSQQWQAMLKNLKELGQLEAMAEGRELSSWAFLAKGGALG